MPWDGRFSSRSLQLVAIEMEEVRKQESFKKFFLWDLVRVMYRLEKPVFFFCAGAPFRIISFSFLRFKSSSWTLAREQMSAVENMSSARSQWTCIISKWIGEWSARFFCLDIARCVSGWRGRATTSHGQPLDRAKDCLVLIPGCLRKTDDRFSPASIPSLYLLSLLLSLLLLLLLLLLSLMVD